MKKMKYFILSLFILAGAACILSTNNEMNNLKADGGQIGSVWTLCEPVTPPVKG